jgi:S1-C subfamily serine protease
VERTITTLRGLVRPGNSGGPLINSAGEVEATVFAAVVGSPEHGGFAVPAAIVADELAHARAARGPTGTGQCAG